MKRFLVSLMLFALVPFTASASSQSEASASGSTATAADYFDAKVSIDYSPLFDVEYHGTYKLVTVTQPWPGAESGFSYLLVQRGTEVPEGIEADKTIEIPVESIVSLSTTYLPHIEMLDELDSLIATDALAWISSEAVLERIDSGAIKEVGSGPTVNIELLIDMEPDLIMAYGMGGEWDTHPKLEEARLPYVINAEWNEQTPLGRAEWLKYMSVFYNKEAAANELFDSIVARYNEVAEVASRVNRKPAVFSGAPYQGTWWVSGGGSYAARFLRDAGADYVWSNDDSTGSLMLDIETVYEQAGEADIWINTGYWSSLSDAKAADERFANFKAFKTGMLYNNNARMGPGGGNEYFESSPAKPHVLLADLVKLFHPDLLPDHELYYYKKLD